MEKPTLGSYWNRWKDQRRMRHIKEQKEPRQMSSIIESEIPKHPPTCGDCEEEETCWRKREAICCQHPECPCETEEASVGDIVQIYFLDHAQDSADGPILCTVYGCVKDQGEHYITVASWQTHVDDFEDTTFTIVTSCITSLVVLKQQPSS